MRYALVLVLALLALGGCSRCEREDPQPEEKPKPKPGPFEVFMVQRLWWSVPQGLPAFLYPSLQESPTDHIFQNVPNFIPFSVSDTSWTRYEWRFGSGQSYSGKRVTLYFPESGFSDTVTVTAYNADGTDSSRAGMRFHLLGMTAWPHYGDYQGELRFMDRPPVLTTIQLKRSLPRYTGNIFDGGVAAPPAIQMTGLFRAACGFPDTILFDIAYANAALQLGFGLESNFVWRSRFERNGNCLPFNRVRLPNQMLFVNNDSLIIVSVHPDNGIYTPNRSLIFRGKKL